jgi:oxygen-independent coproporphyrinogen-3 oxidase
LQRNFQGHTTHGHCDLIGLGLSAISQIGDLYCQNSGDLEQYQGSLENGQLPTVRGWPGNRGLCNGCAAHPVLAVTE